MTQILIFFLILVAVTCAGFDLALTAGAYAARGLRCISFRDQESFLELLTDFDRAKISSTDRPLSTSQMAYTPLGTWSQKPRELWIRESEYEKAKALVLEKYLAEETEFSLVVKEKKKNRSDA